MFFFNSIYYYLYNKSKRGNAVPEIPVLGFISFCQTNNIILIINLFLIIGNFNNPFMMQYAIIILNIIIYPINYYYYQTKKNGKKILLQKKKYVLRYHGIWINLYLFFSTIFAGYSYHIYREYFWKPFLD